MSLEKVWAKEPQIIQRNMTDFGRTCGFCKGKLPKHRKNCRGLRLHREGKDQHKFYEVLKIADDEFNPPWLNEPGHPLADDE